jgi:hypothetical protein
MCNSSQCWLLSWLLVRHRPKATAQLLPALLRRRPDLLLLLPARLLLLVTGFSPPTQQMHACMCVCRQGRHAVALSSRRLGTGVDCNVRSGAEVGLMIPVHVCVCRQCAAPGTRRARGCAEFEARRDQK